MTTLLFSTPNRPTVTTVTKRDDGPAIGLDGSPAGVALFVDRDLIRSRAHLLQLFAALKAAVLAEAQ